MKKKLLFGLGSLFTTISLSAQDLDALAANFQEKFCFKKSIVNGLPIKSAMMGLALTRSISRSSTDEESI
jgi:hypothetical protein